MNMLAFDLIVVGTFCLGAALLLRISAWRQDAMRSLSQPRPRIHTDSWPCPRTTLPLSARRDTRVDVSASSRNIWRSPLD